VGAKRPYQHLAAVNRRLRLPLSTPGSIRGCPSQSKGRYECRLSKNFAHPEIALKTAGFEIDWGDADLLIRPGPNSFFRSVNHFTYPDPQVRLI
jgi:hypothetical protein